MTSKNRLRIAGKKHHAKCPPCPKCHSKKHVTVMWEGKKLIAVCSHCAITAELRPEVTT